jgi:tetratricopeptide (TPR) repeat protein
MDGMWSSMVENLRKYFLPVSLLAVLLLVAIAYGNSLHNGFVWDDETFIVNNSFVHNLSLWPQYFTNPESISKEPDMMKMYRPVQTLSFAFDALLWNKWAGGFHLTSLLLHIATCAAIIFSFSLLVGLTPAIIAALIFAVHPALSEGVLNLAARGNQLYTLFTLISLGFFLRTTRVFDRHHILSVMAFMLALFSKEPAIAFVAILPAVQAVSGRPWKLRTKQSVFLYVPIVLAATFYLAARSLVVDTTSTMPYWGGSLWATIQMQCEVFFIYLKLLLWPFHLQGRYNISPPAPFPDLRIIGAALTNAALILSAIVLYRHGAKGKLFALAVAWFYLSLAPVANLIPLPGSMMGERFIYLTFAGVIPLVAGMVDGKGGKILHKAGVLLGALLLVAWVVTDVARTTDWKDNKSFFSLLVKQEPLDGAVQLNMAKAELLSHDVTSSLKRLKMIADAELLLSKPPDAKVHFWYGKALLAADRPFEAYKEFSLVEKLKPSGEVAFFLAESAARSGNLAGARSILEEELKSSHKNDALWNSLGNVLLMAGDTSGAVSSYRQALAINPRNYEAAVNLENALKGGRPSQNSHQHTR